ncbi:MAG: hypothetical protein J3K34DRAFT_405152, partial [Monoraphidium minutum]
PCRTRPSFAAASNACGSQLRIAATHPDARPAGRPAAAGRGRGRHGRALRPARRQALHCGRCCPQLPRRGAPAGAARAAIFRPGPSPGAPPPLGGAGFRFSAVRRRSNAGLPVVPASRSRPPSPPPARAAPAGPRRPAARRPPNNRARARRSRLHIGHAFVCAATRLPSLALMNPRSPPSPTPPPAACLAARARNPMLGCAEPPPDLVIAPHRVCARRRGGTFSDLKRGTTGRARAASKACTCRGPGAPWLGTGAGAPSRPPQPACRPLPLVCRPHT